MPIGYSSTHTQYGGYLPPLNLSLEEIRKTVLQLFKGKSSDTFGRICNHFAQQVKDRQANSDQGSNVIYEGAELLYEDKEKIKEVLWDLIVERILTPVDFQQNSLQQITLHQLAVTERGRESLAKSNG